MKKVDYLILLDFLYFISLFYSAIIDILIDVL
jgi:hypothetical protein